MKDSIRRVVTAVVAAPAVLGLAYLGGWWFAALIATIGLIMQSEIYAIASSSELRPVRPVGWAVGLLVVAGVMWPVAWPVALALTVAFVAVSPFVMGRDRFLENLAVTLLPALYPTGMLAALVGLREGRGPSVGDLDAFALVVLTLFLVWATDIFAYYVGKNVGRRPLAPSISPKKTWEGSVGGAVAAVLVAVAFKLVVLDALSWLDVAVLSVICGVVSQTGDLAESQIKRSAGVKDASSILPGHGGLFDRFDAMTLAAPLVYLYLRFAAGVIG